MRILTDNTGRGQLQVLSALAADSEMRQKEIVEKTSLSKGAVSNNVRKLKEKELVQGEEKFDLNEEKLLELYREHLETFLIRDKDEPEALNDLRTNVKKNIADLVQEEEVIGTIVSVLEVADEREDLESLNSVFKEADRILKQLSKPELELMGLATDKSNTVTENKKIAEKAEDMLNEVKE